MISANLFFKPDWSSQPKSVHAIVTTREGGVSMPPYSSLNLADHVGDSIEHVIQNRLILSRELPGSPIWLKQVHGTDVSTPQSRLINQGFEVEADAAVSNISSEVLAILTADCMPVLFASKKGECIGVAHAGWRGLCNGVLENTVSAMLALSPNLSPADILVWLGPAIGSEAFEVGADVFEAFINQGSLIPNQAFIPINKRPGKFLANLYLLAQSRLKAVGVTSIEGGNLCTFTDCTQFFSYRRDGQTGRFASLIWLS